MLILFKVIGMMLCLLLFFAAIKLIFVAIERFVTWLLSKAVVPRTRWGSAVLVGFINSVLVSDLLVAKHHANHLSHAWLEASASSGMLAGFCGPFFLFIFLDKRTRWRGLLVLISWILLTGIIIIF